MAGEGSPTLLPTAASDASRPGLAEALRRICSQKWSSEQSVVSGPYRNRALLKPSVSRADFQSEHPRREGLSCGESSQLLRPWSPSFWAEAQVSSAISCLLRPLAAFQARGAGAERS